MVTSLSLVTILLVHFFVDLFVANLTEQTVADLHTKNALKIFHKGQQSIVAELASAAELFRAIVAMETYVQPLNLQCSNGGLDVALREHLHDTHHFFKPMEMVHWQG